MSQIYYNVVANGNITFSKSKPSSENDEFDPDNYMSKDEAIRFIEYLRKKEKPVLLHKRGRTMFNRYDLYDNRIKRLTILKECNSPENAYVSLAKEHGLGCVSKKVRAALNYGIWYVEDFFEYLISIGVDKQEAALFTDMVACGRYKEYCKWNVKKKNLRDISEDLHLFASAASLPSRDWLKDCFSYEYKLFKQYEERLAIETIADDKERFRAELLQFLNSKSIREYLKNIGYEFSSLEAAWIIFNSKNYTLERKLEAWKKLVDTMPDCEMQNRFSEDKYSLHELLEKITQAVERFMKDFYDNSDGSFYEVLEKKYYQDEEVFLGVYSFFDAFKNSLEKRKKPDEDTFSFICRKVLMDGERIPAEVEFTKSFKVLNINSLGTDKDGIKRMLREFEGLWFDFPVPFKKGDIVYCPREERLMTVERINSQGMNEEDLTHRRRYGYSRDMDYSGYFVSLDCDAEGVYKDSGLSYMDLEAYQGPLEGFLRTLEPISEMLKGGIDEKECRRRYLEIVAEEHQKKWNEAFSDCLYVTEKLQND